jgi:murein DD-endopeptidase
MTAKIPIAVSLTGKKKKAFQAQLKKYIAKLEKPAEKQLALNEQDKNSTKSAL